MDMLDLSSIYENEFDHSLWIGIYSLSAKVAKQISILIFAVHTAIEILHTYCSFVRNPSVTILLGDANSG